MTPCEQLICMVKRINGVLKQAEKELGKDHMEYIKELSRKKYEHKRP